MAADAKRHSARDLTTAAAARPLAIQIGDTHALAEVAAVYDRVDAGGGGRVLLGVPS
ncbi:MAG: hypothetical protein ABR615_05795 [Pseudonocardiaceae bacterium]